MLKKDLVSTPILAHLAQIRVPSFFFSKISYCQSLDIMDGQLPAWQNLVKI